MKWYLSAGTVALKPFIQAESLKAIFINSPKGLESVVRIG